MLLRGTIVNTVGPMVYTQKPTRYLFTYFNQTYLVLYLLWFPVITAAFLYLADIYLKVTP